HRVAALVAQRRGKWFARQAHGADGVTIADVDQNLEYHWMHVNGEVAVDVRQRQAGGEELLQLRDDLVSQLRAHAGSEEVPEAGGDRCVAEQSAGVDEQRNLAGRQRRASLDEHQVQADAQCRRGAGQIHRLAERLPVHHQAGVAEDALAVRAQNAGVDAARHAEVVRGDDQAAPGVHDGVARRRAWCRASTTRPSIDQLSSRSRRTIPKVSPFAGSRPSRSKISTLPPSCVPALAGTKKVSASIATDSTSMVIARLSDGPASRQVSTMYTSTTPMHQPPKKPNTDITKAPGAA